MFSWLICLSGLLISNLYLSLYLPLFFSPVTESYIKENLDI
ncbi:hypothetical protein LINGRAHAP2_LOCUS4726 [Linum grandiflorum]